MKRLSHHPLIAGVFYLTMFLFLQQQLSWAERLPLAPEPLKPQEAPDGFARQNQDAVDKKNDLQSQIWFAPQQSQTGLPASVAADVNFDGVVDIQDLILKANDFGKNVDITDLVTISKEFGADVIAQLQETYQNSDTSLRLQVVNALGKIVNERSAEVLVEALGDQDTQIVQRVGDIFVNQFKGKGIGALIKGLKHENKEIRSESALRLGHLRVKEAVDALIDLASQDQESVVRRSAVWALGAIEDARAIPTLVAALGEEDVSLRIDAINALKNFKEAAVPGLLKGIEHEKKEIRSGAAYVLGEMKAAVAVELLMQLVQQDKEISVRREAVRALGAIGDARALPALVAALGDSDSSVRSDARNAVKNFKEAAIPELINGLKSSNVQVRLASISLLTDLKAAAAVESLAQLVQQDKEVSVRRAVVSALAAIGGVEVLPALVNALGDTDFSVRNDARSAVKDFKEAAIPALINGLKNDNVQVRLASISLLTELKTPAAVEPLMQLVQQDKEISVRRAVVTALGAIGDARAISALVIVLGDEEYFVRSDAWSQLQKFKEAAIPELLKGLNHEKALIREWSAYTLGAMKAVAAVDSLIQLVQNDEKISVRLEAVSALGAIGDARAIPVLVVALGDEAKNVRDNAWDGLKKFKEAAIPELLKGLRYENMLVRSRAADLLGEMKAVAAVDSLIQLVQGDKESSVRSAAVNALGAIGDVRVLPVLVTAFGDSDSSVRSEARETIKGFREAAVPELLKGLQSEKPLVRQWSAMALGDMKVASAVEPLIQLVQLDKESDVRRSAVAALGAIGDIRTLPVLVSALGDSDFSVRSDVRDAVRSFKETAVPELISGLKNDNFKIRAESAFLLWEMKTTAALDLDKIAPFDQIYYLTNQLDSDFGQIGAANRLYELFEQGQVGEEMVRLAQEKVVWPRIRGMQGDFPHAYTDLLVFLGAIAIDPLIANLHDVSAETNTRKESGRLLGAIGARIRASGELFNRILAELVRTLESPYAWWIKAETVNGLRILLDAQESKELILSLQEHSNFSVRTLAKTRLVVLVGDNKPITELSVEELIARLDTGRDIEAANQLYSLYEQGQVGEEVIRLAQEKVVWPRIRELTFDSGAEYVIAYMDLVNLRVIAIDPLIENLHNPGANTDTHKWSGKLLGFIGARIRASGELFNKILEAMAGVFGAFPWWVEEETESGLWELLRVQPSEVLLVLTNHPNEVVRRIAIEHAVWRGIIQ
ncbi:MAG: HEAT repeat domain-containing protein [Candidatus Omnitrophica bacterium]|nr:HEAT repeat domain-containing protein [Candidatus Omnitrophota bacterium]